MVCAHSGEIIILTIHHDIFIPTIQHTLLFKDGADTLKWWQFMGNWPLGGSLEVNFHHYQSPLPPLLMLGDNIYMKRLNLWWPLFMHAEHPINCNWVKTGTLKDSNFPIRDQFCGTNYFNRPYIYVRIYNIPCFNLVVFIIIHN